MISRHTSSMALMLRHASAAGSSAASMTLRWMPLEKTSPPDTTTTCRVPGRGVAQRRSQPAALAGRHRAVVEVERHDPDGALPAVGDLSVPDRRPAASSGARASGTSPSRWPSTDTAGSLEVRSPSPARGGRAPPRPRRRRCARARPRAGGQRRCPVPQRGGSGMGVEDRDGQAAQRGAHAGRAVTGPDAAQHVLGRVRPRELPIAPGASAVATGQGLRRPWPRGVGTKAGSADFAITSRISSIAASATDAVVEGALAGGVTSSGNVRCAQIGPASISSAACSAVTPHSPPASVIAQSNDEGHGRRAGPGG